MAGSTNIGDPGPRPPFPAPRAIPADIADERRAARRGTFPPGATRPSFRNTRRFRHDILNLLLEYYQSYGPIFGVRIIFSYNLALIGPEANHFVLVSGRENFAWRNGRLGDLLTLIGDGLLTTDGALPRRRAGDHDAGLPSRSGHRVRRGHARRDGAGGRGADAERDARRLRMGPHAGDAGRDEGPVRLQPGLGAGDR